MDFDLSEEQVRLRAAAKELAANFDDDYWLARDRDCQFPWEFHKAFAGQGWFGIAIPECYGGGGLGVLEAGLMLGEIAASGAGVNGCSSLHLTIFTSNIVLKHGSNALRDELLPNVAAGKVLAAFAVTEAEAGTDTSRITTFARAEGSHYVISGRKLWTSNADKADHMLVLARTTPRDQVSKPTDGMTLFLVDVDPKHVEIRPIPKLGRNAISSNEVLIDGLRVSSERRIGVEGEGFQHILDGFNPERILLAHEAVGIGRAALRRAVEYAQRRVVFDRPIGQNQAVQFPLAAALARLDAAELTTHKAAWLYDQGRPCGREANTAKLLAAEAAFQAADDALQVFGGLGYAKEYHVERYWREARLLRLAPVTQELVLSYLGQHVLGLPRSY